MAFSVRCTIMQTPERGELQVLRNVLVCIDDGGLITSITPAAAAAAAGATAGDGAADVVLPPTTIVLPGLVDAHIHAPQWPSLGTGLDLPLEAWLATRTYPAERRLTDPAAAAAVWPALVATLLAHGTTTAVYYATIDVTTTTMLAAAAAEAGQRAFVGRGRHGRPGGHAARLSGRARGGGGGRVGRLGGGHPRPRLAARRAHPHAPLWAGVHPRAARRPRPPRRRDGHARANALL